MLKEKKCQPTILYPVKMSFRKRGEIKTYSDYRKILKIATSIPALKEWIKEILYTEGKLFFKTGNLEQKHG